MNYKPKKYTVISNILFLQKCTAKYLPSLIVWVLLSIAVKVSIPTLEIFIPKIVITKITTGDSWQNLIFVVVTVTLSLALLRAFSKFCERCIYYKKNLMGTHYIHKIANKVLTTDYANRESDNFRTLQEESYQMCQHNESILRNVYYGVISFFTSIIGFIFYFAILTNLNIFILVFLIITTVLSYFIGLGVSNWTNSNNAEKTKYFHKLGYIDASSEDIKSAKDIRLYVSVKYSIFLL